MRQKLYAVYGASGCGRGTTPLARAQLRREGGKTGQLRLSMISLRQRS